MSASTARIALVLTVCWLASTPIVAQQCTWRLGPPKSIEVDGWTIYVEPRAVEAGPDGLLVVGQPTYMTSFERGRMARDSILGVLVRPDGTATLIPAEAGVSAGSQGILALDAAWSLFQVITEASSGFPSESPSVAVEHLTLEVDGTVRSSEVLPHPVEDLHATISPTPVRLADGRTSWAVLRRPQERSAVWYLGRPGHWSSWVTPAMAANSVELGVDERGAVLIAPGRPEGLEAEVALGRWRWDGSGDPIYEELYAVPGNAPTEPVFDRPDRPTSLAWEHQLLYAGERRWAVAPYSAERGVGDMQLMGTNVTSGQAVPGVPGTTAWIVTEVEGDQDVLSIYRAPVEARREAQFPYPFDGGVFGIVQDAPQEWTLVGARLTHTGDGPLLGTVLQALSATCD